MGASNFLILDVEFAEMYPRFSKENRSHYECCGLFLGIFIEHDEMKITLDTIAIDSMSVTIILKQHLNIYFPRTPNNISRYCV